MTPLHHQSYKPLLFGDAPRILIIRFRLIGDVLLVTPLLQNLRRQFPGAHLTLLTDVEAAPVVENHPVLDELLLFRAPKFAGRLAKMTHVTRLLWKLRQSHFDLSINLQPGKRGGLATRFAAAKYRAGYARAGENMAPYNVHIPYEPGKRYRVEHMLDALRALGLQAKMELPTMGIGDRERHAVRKYFQSTQSPVVVIHPGRVSTRKTWLDDRFAALIDKLHDSFGAHVLLVGAPDERERAARIATLSKASPRVVAGELNLPELGAAIERADLFIGIDSAPLHIASAVKTPTVALFGFSNVKEWNPPGEMHIAIQKWVSSHPCDPPHCCEIGNCPCMKNIEVEDVVVAVRKLLEHRAQQMNHENPTY